jgi:hypothetical protein
VAAARQYRTATKSAPQWIGSPMQSREQIGVLLLMFKAQRQVRLQRDAVELV